VAKPTGNTKVPGVLPHGRPTKLTQEVQDRFLEALRVGNFYEACCGYAGIDYGTLRQWMIKGGQGKQPYANFRQAVLKAEADAEARIVANWQQHIPSDWRAARDFLGRRHADRWGPRDKVEHSGPGGAPLQIVYTQDWRSQQAADAEAGEEQD